MLSKEEKAWAKFQWNSFIDHQNRKIIADFWNPIHSAFFTKFPIISPDVTEIDQESCAAAARKSEVKFRISNNSTWKSRAQAKDTVNLYILGQPSSCPSRAKLHARSHKKKEVYFSLFYNTECKLKVDAEIALHSEGITKSKRMSICNKYTNEGWEAAQKDPEKMKQIEEVLNTEKAAKKEPEEIIPEEKSEKILHANPLITDFATKIGTVGDLAVSILAAGFDPNNDHKLQSYGFHYGTDVHRQAFDKAMPDYQNQVHRLFLNFASTALSKRPTESAENVGIPSDAQAKTTSAEGKETSMANSTSLTQLSTNASASSLRSTSMGADSASLDVYPVSSTQSSSSISCLESRTESGSSGDCSPATVTQSSPIEPLSPIMEFSLLTAAASSQQFKLCLQQMPLHHQLLLLPLCLQNKGLSHHPHSLRLPLKLQLKVSCNIVRLMCRQPQASSHFLLLMHKSTQTGM
ncbi:hypothetical protein GYMLUDRAFT_240470 [Collybiopsis luxurians FD-317 M1]|nr:hypothetical protein GYMLUDRAFT_240470 [Collybiopsis luxurians FD-317 M1]